MPIPFVGDYRQGFLPAVLLLSSSGHIALASPADEQTSSPPLEARRALECDELRPALGFLVGSTLHVSDTLESQAVGDKLQVTVRETPPAETLLPFEGHEEWGNYAIAVVVNTSRDAAATVPIRRKTTETVDCFATSCICTTDQFERTDSYRLDEDSYTEAFCCSSFSSAADCKLLRASGAEYLKTIPPIPFPVVPDSFVVFIDKDAPAGSEFAKYLFNSPNGLSAGYYLVEYRPGFTLEDRNPRYVYRIQELRLVSNHFEIGVTPAGLNL